MVRETKVATVLSLRAICITLGTRPRCGILRGTRHLFLTCVILTKRLVTQLENLGIEFVAAGELATKLNHTDAILDAIFGFSFSGEPRDPFKSALEAIIAAQKKDNLPIVSVDIPSSWGVDSGRGESVLSQSFVPDVLISLTAPKIGSRTFTGRHWLGGRFVDAPTAEKYDLKLPRYPGTSQVVDVTGVQPCM